jgi:hypothetical protein
MPNLVNVIRVRMNFQSGNVGWSESHFLNGITDITGVPCYTAMLNLAYARAKLLDGATALMIYVVASLEGISRDVRYLAAADLPIPSGGVYNGGNSSLQNGWGFLSPHVSWPIKLLDANENEICISYVAGYLTATSATGPGPYQSTGKLPGNALTTYADFLATGPYGAASRVWPVGVQTPTNSTVMTGQPTYTPAAGSVPPILTFNVTNPGVGGTVIPGGYFRVWGLKYSAPQNRLRLNGTYQAQTVTGTAVTAYVPRLRAAPTFGLSPGYVQASGYAIQDYSSFTLDPMTHRKRGVGSDRPRGRRSSA